MILTSLSQKQPVYIHTPEAVYPNPKGAGSIVLAAGERFMVSQSFSQIMAMMSGTGAQPQQPQQLTSSQRDSGGGGVVGIGLEVLEQRVQVDPSTAPSMVNYVASNNKCKQILEHWFKLYEQTYGQYPNTIGNTTIGTICGAVSRGDTEKAIEVLTWQWTSDHYRARYLRNQGMIDPAVVLRKSKINENYAMAQQAKLEAVQQSTTTEEIRFCPKTGEML